MLKFVFASVLIVPTAFGQIALTTAQLAKRVSPAVVVIEGKADAGGIQGSGFVISKDGKIVTNLHVIRDMKTATVQLANGEIFHSISVLAVDERRDLAIVQVSGLNLPVLDLGNSDALTVGEPLVIVGSPRGLEGTVTAGILSSVRDSGEGFKVLQTDAAVNPGNSGGPLVNSKGQAIGVVSFKMRSAEGLNFAIPINYVRGLLTHLHEPMTLEQMRLSLSASPAPDQDSVLPPLKETLDFLKEKIPLGTVQYVRLLSMNINMHGFLLRQSVNIQSAAWNTDSCTVMVGEVSTSKNLSSIYIEGGAPEDTDPDVMTTRYTVPLEQLTGWTVERQENEDTADNIFVSGERWGYRVVLTSSSKVIRGVISDSGLSAFALPFSASYYGLHMIFNDESVARRVSEAFHHASDLCRKEKVF